MTKRTHLSARELAALRVPGLPGSTPRIEALARSQHWHARRGDASPAAVEYDISTLPVALQAAISLTWPFPRESGLHMAHFRVSPEAKKLAKFASTTAVHLHLCQLWLGSYAAAVEVKAEQYTSQVRRNG